MAAATVALRARVRARAHDEARPYAHRAAPRLSAPRSDVTLRSPCAPANPTPHMCTRRAIASASVRACHACHHLRHGSHGTGSPDAQLFTPTYVLRRLADPCWRRTSARKRVQVSQPEARTTAISVDIRQDESKDIAHKKKKYTRESSRSTERNRFLPFGCAMSQQARVSPVTKPPLPPPRGTTTSVPLQPQPQSQSAPSQPLHSHTFDHSVQAVSSQTTVYTAPQDLALSSTAQGLAPEPVADTLSNGWATTNDATAEEPVASTPLMPLPSGSSATRADAIALGDDADTQVSAATTSTIMVDAHAVPLLVSGQPLRHYSSIDSEQSSAAIGAGTTPLWDRPPTQYPKSTNTLLTAPATTASEVSQSNTYLSQTNVINSSTSTYSPLTQTADIRSAAKNAVRALNTTRNYVATNGISASASFFGIPRNLSSASLRSALGWDAPTAGGVDWISIAVVYWITLVSEASRGLMLPSTWPYLQSLGGTKAQLGLVVASFSMGRMATTIPLGYLSDKYSTSTVLTGASAIQVIGHLVYAVAPTVPILVASRIIVGFGSATMSVCRAHITRAVPSGLRTHHFAYLSALQFIGFAVLPGAGGLLAMIPESSLMPGVNLNGFTYPAYVLVFCNILAAAMIYMMYFDPPPATQPTRTQPPPQPPQQQTTSAQAVSTTSLPQPVPPAPATEPSLSPDTIALIVCLLVNVTFRGIVAELETVATPFLMEKYTLNYQRASFLISIVGFFGLGVYLGFKPIAKRFSDRDLVITGLVFVLIGSAPLGYAWFTSHMSLSVYVACLGIIWSLAYPIGQTAVMALFSKVLAGLPPGRSLGIFSASGSLARILFALFAGKVWGMFGRDAVFATVLGYVSLAILMTLLTYRRLAPAV